MRTLPLTKWYGGPKKNRLGLGQGKRVGAADVSDRAKAGKPERRIQIPARCEPVNGGCCEILHNSSILHLLKYHLGT